MIDLTKYNKAEVLAALYNHSKSQGMGILHYTPEPMTKKEAQVLLKRQRYFDYFNGRILKVDLSGDELDPGLYDRDNGQGAAERAILTLTCLRTKALRLLIVVLLIFW